VGYCSTSLALKKPQHAPDTRSPQDSSESRQAYTSKLQDLKAPQDLNKMPQAVKFLNFKTSNRKTSIFQRPAQSKTLRRFKLSNFKMLQVQDLGGILLKIPQNRGTAQDASRHFKTSRSTRPQAKHLSGKLLKNRDQDASRHQEPAFNTPHALSGILLKIHALRRQGPALDSCLSSRLKISRCLKVKTSAGNCSRFKAL
jgi:hypothetical protein